MRASAPRRSRLTRSRSIAVAVLAAVSVLWLAYALALDIHYRRFPEVLLGAVQILAAFYVFLGIAALAWRGLKRLGGSLARGVRKARP